MNQFIIFLSALVLMAIPANAAEPVSGATTIQLRNCTVVLDNTWLDQAEEIGAFLESLTDKLLNPPEFDPAESQERAQQMYDAVVAVTGLRFEGEAENAKIQNAANFIQRLREPWMYFEAAPTFYILSQATAKQHMRNGHQLPYTTYDPETDVASLELQYGFDETSPKPWLKSYFPLPGDQWGRDDSLTMISELAVVSNRSYLLPQNGQGDIDREYAEYLSAQSMLFSSLQVQSLCMDLLVQNRPKDATWLNNNWVFNGLLYYLTLRALDEAGMHKTADQMKSQMFGGEQIVYEPDPRLNLRYWSWPCASFFDEDSLLNPLRKQRQAAAVYEIHRMTSEIGDERLRELMRGISAGQFKSAQDIEDYIEDELRYPIGDRLDQYQLADDAEGVYSAAIAGYIENRDAEVYGNALLYLALAIEVEVRPQGEGMRAELLEPTLSMLTKCQDPQTYCSVMQGLVALDLAGRIQGDTRWSPDLAALTTVIALNDGDLSWLHGLAKVRGEIPWPDPPTDLQRVTVVLLDLVECDRLRVEREFEQAVELLDETMRQLDALDIPDPQLGRAMTFAHGVRKKIAEDRKAIALEEQLN